MVLWFSWLHFPSGTPLVEVQLILTRWTYRWKACFGFWNLLVLLVHIWTGEWLMSRVLASSPYTILLWTIIIVILSLRFAANSWANWLKRIVLNEVINSVVASPRSLVFCWMGRYPLAESRSWACVNDWGIVFHSLLKDQAFTKVGHCFLHASSFISTTLINKIWI